MTCGTKHYARLMSHFNIVVDVFLRLDKPFQDAIADITRRMGYGMAEFIEKEVRERERRDTRGMGDGGRRRARGGMEAGGEEGWEAEEQRSSRGGAGSNGGGLGWDCPCTRHKGSVEQMCMGHPLDIGLRTARQSIGAAGAR